MLSLQEWRTKRCGNCLTALIPASFEVRHLSRSASQPSRGGGVRHAVTARLRGCLLREEVISGCGRGTGDGELSMAMRKYPLVAK